MAKTQIIPFQALIIHASLLIEDLLAATLIFAPLNDVILRPIKQSVTYTTRTVYSRKQPNGFDLFYEKRGILSTSV